MDFQIEDGVEIEKLKQPRLHAKPALNNWPKTNIFNFIASSLEDF